MTAKTSGDSTRGVSGIIFRAIHDSFTTQGLKARTPADPGSHSHLGVKRRVSGGPKPCLAGSVKLVYRRGIPMPYALFSNDTKLSKAYPTEADVWKHARKSGLVVDVMTGEKNPSPRPVLDNDYEIKPCRPEPHEDPAQNEADAEREEQFQVQP